jgi:hypothetical protein
MQASKKTEKKPLVTANVCGYYIHYPDNVVYHYYKVKTFWFYVSQFLRRRHVAIPQSVLDALNTVDSDESGVDTAKSTAATSATALTAATEAAANDSHAVDNAKQKLTSDKAALVALINSTYTGDQS